MNIFLVNVIVLILILLCNWLDKQKQGVSEMKPDAMQLYKLLDGFVGIISEQGWEGLDRHWGDGCKSSILLSNIKLLKILNKSLGNKFEKECIEYGIISYK
jgi:hypothetical protein